MTPDPVVIPVPDRYGACEGKTCVHRLLNRITDKKPMFDFCGQRLCRDCTRQLQRAVTA